MDENKPLGPRPEREGPETPRNPFILNFCKALVERKGEKLEPDALDRLLLDMYRLYENMLGQNMVKALPEDVRKEYLTLCEDLNNLNYERIGEIFDRNIPNYKEIMKDTMKEFSQIYLKNRDFDPKDYPVSQEFNPVACVEGDRK